MLGRLKLFPMRILRKIEPTLHCKNADVQLGYTFVMPLGTGHAACSCACTCAAVQKLKLTLSLCSITLKVG